MNLRYAVGSICVLVGLATLSVAVAPPVAATAEGVFQVSIDLVRGLAGAHSVQTADLDQDGDLDVIAVGRNSGEVLWLQNMRGTSPQFVKRPVGNVEGVYAAYPADLNGDGASDILVTGVGTLRPAAQSSAEATGADAAIDPAEEPTAVDGTSNVVWFENKLHSANTFIRRVVVSGLHYPVAVHAADLDRDQDLDILVAARDGNTIRWYINSGGPQPTFTERVISNSAKGAVSVHAADFDRDGDLDVISASEDDNKIAWYANDGAYPPNFAERVIRQFPPPDPKLDYAKAVYAIDLDNDRDMDVAYASEDNNQVGWLQNQGNATGFTDYVLATDVDHAKAVFAADVDEDGDTDLLAASSDDNRITWFANSGTTPPTFTPQVVTVGAVGARGVHAADLDGDGDTDLLSASREDNRIAWYPNRTIHRNAYYLEQTNSVVAVIQQARSVFAADMDRDGDLDMLSVAEEDVSWYENNGAAPPAFTRRIISTALSGGRTVYAADLDRDGDLDVVTASRRDNMVAWYENLGGTPLAFTQRVVTQQALGARAALAADLDKDGDIDLYSASDTDNAVSWYENNGATPPAFVRRILTNGAAYARSVYAADLDADGDLDLMAAAQGDSALYWFANDGARPPNFSEFLIAKDGIGVQHVHADDLDGDGDLDVISASELDNSIHWYENQGGTPPTFASRLVTNRAPAVHAVYTGDADLDGDPDIFAAIEGNNTVAWYENNGAAPLGFTQHVIVNNHLVAHGIYAADLDKDSDIDVLAASREDGKVAWYENLGGQYAFAPGPVVNQPPSVALSLVVSHRGRPGDPNIEMASLKLLLTDKNDKPLDPVRANALIQKLMVYRLAVCCDQPFDPNRDKLVASVSPLTLSPTGYQEVTFLDGDANVLVGVDAPAAFAIVTESNANTCLGATRPYRIYNVLTSRGAQDGETDLPVIAEGMRSFNPDDVINIKPQGSLLINEFMAGNNNVIVDPDEPFQYPDWLEIYNTSTNPVTLSGKYLTDDLTVPNKYLIPEGVTIAPGGFVVFYADGEPHQGPLHTNFRLSKNGESIGLYDSDANGMALIDAYAYGSQANPTSEGRYPDGTARWTTLSAPTPGAVNLLYAGPNLQYLPIISLSPLCE